MHGGVHLHHRLGTGLSRQPGLVGKRLGLFGIVGGAADHHRHLFQGGACFSDARALLLTALGERLAGGGKLAGGAGCLRRPFLKRIGDHAERPAHRPDDCPADERPEQARCSQRGENHPETGRHLLLCHFRFIFGELDVVVDVFIEALYRGIEDRLDLGPLEVGGLFHPLATDQIDHLVGGGHQRVPRCLGSAKKLLVLGIGEELFVGIDQFIGPLTGCLKRGLGSGHDLLVGRLIDDLANVLRRVVVELDDLVERHHRGDGIGRQIDDVFIDGQHPPQAQAAQQQREQNERNKAKRDATRDSPGAHG